MLIYILLALVYHLLDSVFLGNADFSDFKLGLPLELITCALLLDKLQRLCIALVSVSFYK